MATLFKNDALTTISGAITDAGTTIELASNANLFPAPTGTDVAYLTLFDFDGNKEIVKLTARSGTTCTVTRGEEGTTARAWPDGARIEQRLTAAPLNEMAAATDINTLTAKATPVDADKFRLADSEASWDPKSLSWAQLKATLGLGATTVDNTIPRFNGTAGQLQTSGIKIDDNDRLTVGDGSAANPSYSFLSSTTNGFYRAGSDQIGVTIGGTERARFSGTEFIVGATTSTGISDGSSANVGAYIGDGTIAAQRNDGPSLYLSKVASTGSVAIFSVSSTQVGSISVTGASTSYNTSSDYRLPWKEGATPIANPGEFIDRLKPYYFPRAGQSGFFAHEFAEVSPASVSGEKDAVDKNGDPIYQSMQASTSDVIAHMVAELQMLRKRVAELEKNQ